MELTEAIELIKNKYIGQESNSFWADLSSGTGLFSYALANLLPTGSIIYAIDKSAATLKNLPNPNNIIIEQQQLDFIIDELNLPNLNGILMANSLHYVMVWIKEFSLLYL